jgi:hypothetical protein
MSAGQRFLAVHSSPLASAPDCRETTRLQEIPGKQGMPEEGLEPPTRGL